MGQGNSQNTAKVQEAQQTLGDDGNAHCKEVFARLVGGGSSQQIPLQTVKTQLFPSLPLAMVECLFHELKRVGSNAGFDEPIDPRAHFVFTDLTLLMSIFVGPDVEKKRQMLFYSMVKYPSNLSPEGFKQLLNAAFEFKPEDPNSTRVADFFQQLAFKSQNGTKDEIETDAFSRFLDAWPMVDGALNELFIWSWCFSASFQAASPLPRYFFGPEPVYTNSQLLDKHSVGALDSQFSLQQRGQWALLFSSKVHGGSFSTMRKNIQNTGATLIVIKDKDGYVFGGFASMPWTKCPDFYGTDSSFLFTLQPQLQVFHPRGQNQNFQYFNYGMEQLPNGLGMGGQMDYFGLFISDKYDSGHCKGHPRSSTFHNLVLSKQQDFRVDEMEVWRIGPLPESDEDEGGKGSILDGRKEDKALLEMAGIKMKSEGLREPPEEEPEIVNGKAKRVVY